MIWYSLLDFEADGQYDGIEDTEIQQNNVNPNRSFAHSLRAENVENPYYDGDFDDFAEDNRQSRNTLQYPDLINTDIVTSTQNVYYEL